MTASGKRVAVIGGGIAGLSVAWRLQGLGHQVVVYESRAAAGGVLQTDRSGGSLRERAANGFIGADDGVGALADELGVDTDEADAAAKRRWIFVNGKLQPLPRGPRELAKSELLSSSGKLRALREPLVPGGARPDDTVDSFFRRRLGDEVAENIIAPFVVGIFAGDSAKLGLVDAFPRLFDMAKKGGVVRGMLRRAGKGRRNSARIRAPRRGMGELIEALCSRLTDVRVGCGVVQVETSEDGVCIHDQLDQRESFDACVVAVPAPAASPLLASIDPEFSALLEQTRFVSVAVAHMLYHRKQVHHPLDGFGFLVREQEDLHLLGCVFESVLWPNRTPDDVVLLRCILGGSRDPAAVTLDDETLIGRCEADLDRALGVSGRPVAAHVVRWPNGIAQYPPGHAARVSSLQTLGAKHRLVFHGSSYAGVSVNDCVAGARRAAASVAALLCFALLFVACSGGAPKATVVDDARTTHGKQGDGASLDKPSESALASFEVELFWLSPPADKVRSPGPNRCGVPRRAPISVHSAGGLRGAAVILEGSEAGSSSTRPIAYIKDCRVEPRLQLAAPGSQLELTSRDEGGATVSLAGKQVALPVIGASHRVTLGERGLTVVSDAADGDAGHVVVTSSRAEISDERGRVVFSKVPVGTYKIRVVHPALDSAVLTRRTEVRLQEGENPRVRIEVKP